MLGPTGHTDSFTRDRLPPLQAWPDLNLTGFDYPDWLNIGVELTDHMVGKGFGDNVALIGNGRSRTYKQLTDWTNRIADVLTEYYGIRPGNRVLIRSANNPAMVACWLAATKAGRWWSTPCRCCGRANWPRWSTRPKPPMRCATPV